MLQHIITVKNGIFGKKFNDFDHDLSVTFLFSGDLNDPDLFGHQ